MAVKNNTYYFVESYEGEKVPTIKKVRELTGVGLKDAKHLLESGLPFALVEEHKTALEKAGVAFKPVNAIKAYFMHVRWIHGEISKHTREIGKLNQRLAEISKFTF